MGLKARLGGRTSRKVPFELFDDKTSIEAAALIGGVSATPDESIRLPRDGFTLGTGWAALDAGYGGAPGHPATTPVLDRYGHWLLLRAGGSVIFRYDGTNLSDWGFTDEPVLTLPESWREDLFWSGPFRKLPITVSHYASSYTPKQASVKAELVLYDSGLNFNGGDVSPINEDDVDPGDILMFSPDWANIPILLPSAAKF